MQNSADNVYTGRTNLHPNPHTSKRPFLEIFTTTTQTPCKCPGEHTPPGLQAPASRPWPGCRGSPRGETLVLCGIVPPGLRAPGRGGVRQRVGSQDLRRFPANYLQVDVQERPKRISIGALTTLRSSMHLEPSGGRQRDHPRFFDEQLGSALGAIDYWRSSGN